MRFSIRDLLWSMVVFGALLGWWTERRKTLAVMRERDEATDNWHDASKKWVEATNTPNEAWHGRGTGGMGGGAAAPPPLPHADLDSN